MSPTCTAATTLRRRFRPPAPAASGSPGMSGFSVGCNKQLPGGWVLTAPPRGRVASATPSPATPMGAVAAASRAILSQNLEWPCSQNRSKDAPSTPTGGSEHSAHDHMRICQRSCCACRRVRIHVSIPLAIGVLWGRPLKTRAGTAAVGLRCARLVIIHGHADIAGPYRQSRQWRRRWSAGVRRTDVKGSVCVCPGA